MDSVLVIRLLILSFPIVVCHPNTITRISELPENSQKLFNFFSGGLTELIWNQVGEGENIDLNEKCYRSIQITQNHIDLGSEWAYRLLDASSKSSSGILEGTLTSYGDFEECLSIVPPNVGLQFVPKYCMVELIPNPSFEHVGNITKYMQSTIPIFGVQKMQFAVCFLSLCTDSDISKIINRSLRDQPFQFTGSLTCETNDDNSWFNRVARTTSTQRVGIFFILLMMGAVSVGTTLHVADTILQLRTNGTTIRSLCPIPEVIDFVENFSCFRSFMNLVTVEENESKIRASELIKLAVIITAIGNQTAFLVETSVGMNVIHRMLDLRKLMSKVMSQPFSAQEVYGILFFASGYVTFKSLHKRNVFGLIKAIGSKYMRLGPVLACLIGFEFIWPLLVSGPLYMKAASELVSKCSNNWWAHLLMVGNTIPFNESCIPHTMVFSSQFQLFLLGVMLVFLLQRLPVIGLTVSSVCLAYATSAFYFNCAHLLSPVMFDREPSFAKTMSYLEIVQRPIFGHAVNYIVGLVGAYLFSNSESPNVTFIAHLSSAMAAAFLFFSPCLHNVFNLITKENYANFVTAVKIVGCFASFVIIRNLEAFIQSFPDEKRTKEQKDQFKVAGTLESIVGEGRVVNLSKALIKLSFSMFLVSYFYIRYDFFTTRILFPIYRFHVLKRIIYTLSFSWVLGVYFHLVFVSPFENIRKSYFTSK